MNATRRCALFAAWLALSASVAAAGDGDERKALDILKKADAATKAVKAFSCKAEFHGTGGLANRVPIIKGTVKARQARPGILGVVFGGKRGRPSQRITGVLTPPGAEKAEPFDIACDGKRAVLIDSSRKIATLGDLPQAKEMLRAGRPLYMLELLHPTPFRDEISAKELRYEGVEEIEGVPCDVVFVVYRNSHIDSRWHFGRDDALPRRVERHHGRLGGSGSMVLTLSELVVGSSFGASVFAPPIPKGYRKRAFQPPLQIGKRAPNWKLRKPDGQTVSLRSLRGNVVVLVFWATWCDFCKQSMPAFQALHEQYAERPVKVFGINCWETDGDPVAYMKAAKLTLPILLGGDKVADRYRVNGLPTFFVIDAKGRIAYTACGMLEQRVIAKHIEMAAAKAKGSK